uniref:Macaca fascicularis brain cDNA clone: QtrA-18251, similar to human unc-51-like kinase 2 (C. elegans) (ULK2), mRNA, RefSeq: NM_014683.2 n=1 Tax=Macaca fascicularis TaxID=9541 RepID=I7GJG9_MACFA|nr:unnamed protein product [Macaca fascicularis]
MKQVQRGDVIGLKSGTRQAVKPCFVTFKLILLVLV